MVITVDDLPANSTSNTLATHRQITTGLLEVLNGIRAYGFVNESKLFVDGELHRDRVALLEQWLKAGHELGNHTYSHPDLHRVPLSEFEADLLRGEKVTRLLSQKAGRAFRYFRHPFLHTGRDLETKEALYRLLHKHGYTIAPVTIDNSEWIFARAYDRALDAANTLLAQSIGAAYDDYMGRVVSYYEQQSVKILGYELPQILLIHANRLNAENLGGLLKRLRSRGYRFVSLEEALADPAYDLPDTFTGGGGITWLHRWALADGKRGEFFAGEPEVPAFVSEAFEDQNP